MTMDLSAARDLFARARVSERFSIADQSAVDGLVAAFDSAMPRDPNYPTRQLVRSSYLAPVDESIPRESFLRVREYLGDVDSRAASGDAFLELKHVAADGTKHKERIGAVAGAVDQLRANPTSATLAAVAAPGADATVVARGARLLDSTPHFLEAGTEYGRLAWEDGASTLRITLDEVAEAGTSLARDGAVKRVLEVKHGGGELPGWVASLLDDALAGGRIARIVPGVYPIASPAGGAVDDAARAASRLAAALR